MKVTVLGCGGSGGVPLIGNEWGACDPQEPKNKRTRPSILIQHQGRNILVDTTPDLREQLLRHSISSLDAVIYTHEHADHTHGIDDLRALNWLMRRPIDIYANAETLDSLTRRFDYIFAPRAAENFFKPSLMPHLLDGDSVNIAGLDFRIFTQDHGGGKASLGVRLGDFAYSTDVKNLDEAAFSALAGVRVWIVDCVRYEPHPTHSHFEQTRAWIRRVQPERAYLTHMNQTMDYAAVKAHCPPGIEPAYDGLTIILGDSIII